MTGYERDVRYVWAPRRIVAWALVLACSQACVRPAVEQHGGLAPRPARMPEVAWVAMGASVDEGLHLVRVPLGPRVAADVVVALGVRNVSTFGRTVDSGFLWVLGSAAANLLRVIFGAEHRP